MFADQRQRPMRLLWELRSSCRAVCRPALPPPVSSTAQHFQKNQNKTEIKDFSNVWWVRWQAGHVLLRRYRQSQLCITWGLSVKSEKHQILTRVIYRIKSLQLNWLHCLGSAGRVYMRDKQSDSNQRRDRKQTTLWNIHYLNWAEFTK